MFERFSHKRNPSLCLPYVQWNESVLECGKCGSYIAYSCDDIQILNPYAHLDDPIMAYIRLNPPKKTAKEDGWSSVKDFKETAIENSKSQLAEIHEETESMRQMMDELERDAPIPFTDIAFDNEDSAAGDFYLSIDAQGEEGEDE